MGLEEKIINGIMHYRTSPDKEFKPYTIDVLSNLYKHQKDSYYRLLEKINKLATGFDNAKDNNLVQGNFYKLEKLADVLIDRLKAL